MRVGTVLVVDAARRTISMHDSDGTVGFAVAYALRHRALPDFELALGPLFALALDAPD